MVKGQFVLSLSGRDEGRIHVITEVLDEQYVLIADGKHRKIEKPKKKKLKHLRSIDETIEDISDLTNRKLIILINEIRRDYSAKR